MRDAWSHDLREDVWGGEFIRSEWKSLTSCSIFAILSRGNGSPLLLKSRYLPHTRSCSTDTWTRASQGSLRHALLPSATSSLLSSSLDVNKCLPPTGSHYLLPLLARFRGVQPTGSPRLPTNSLGRLFANT